MVSDESGGVESFELDDLRVEITYVMEDEKGSRVTPGFESWPWPEESLNEESVTLAGITTRVVSIAGLLDIEQGWEEHLGEKRRAQDLTDIEALQAVLESPAQPGQRIKRPLDSAGHSGHSLGRPLVSLAGQKMIDDVASVPAHGRQRVRQERVEELEGHEVETGHLSGDAPVVDNFAILVEHRKIDPGEAGLEAGAPYDVGHVENGPVLQLGIAVDDTGRSSDSLHSGGNEVFWLDPEQGCSLVAHLGVNLPAHWRARGE